MTAAVGPMNLVELLDRHRDLFYFGYRQWWTGEAFTRVLPSDPLPPFPRKVSRRGSMPNGENERHYPSAVDLVSHYVASPDAAIWREGYRFVCQDKDSQGRRVYLLWEDGKMQIHRWDEPDIRWVCAA